jgi:hypothetical protein
MQRYEPISPSKTAYEKGLELIREADRIGQSNPILADELRKTAKQYFNFDLKTPTDMTKNKQIRYGIISGTAFLLILLVIALTVKCPSSFLVLVSRIILSLAAAGYSICIPGAIDVKANNSLITASGAIAVFILIFFWNPAPFESFNDCASRIEGNVMFGAKPAENVQLSFIEINKSTNTNSSGNFSLEVSASEIPVNLRIRLSKQDIQLDTIVKFANSTLRENLLIELKEHCVTCEQRDNTQKIVNSKVKCSANRDYINNYIEGFLQAAKEQGRIGTCK